MDTLKSLMSVLPADEDREHAYNLARRREHQLAAIHDRAATVHQRIDELTDALADATAKQRSALLAERRDLLAERTALPLDARVVARLYADALADLSERVTRDVTTERSRARDELAKTDGELSRLQYDLRAMSPDSPAHNGVYSAFRALTEQRRPARERLDTLKALLDTMHAHVQAALASPGSAERPGGVKLGADGRPVAAHVVAFVADAGSKAA